VNKTAHLMYIHHLMDGSRSSAVVPGRRHTGPRPHVGGHAVTAEYPCPSWTRQGTVDGHVGYIVAIYAV
jgi:hypothetical protein